MSSITSKPFTKAFVDYMKEYQRLVAIELEGEKPDRRKLGEFGKNLLEATDLFNPWQAYAGFFLEKMSYWDTLTAESGSPTQVAMSTLVQTVGDTLTDYFEKQGLTLSFGLDSIYGKHFLSPCLGKTKTITLNSSPAIIFEEKLIGSTSNYILESSLSGGRFPAWTDGKNTYYDMEFYTDRGKKAFEKLEGSLFHNPLPMKLLELAWQPLYEECKGDKEKFIRIFGAYTLADNHIHEVYHTKHEGLERKLMEAAAELYSVCRSINPFECLLALYEWPSSADANYIQAYELASGYLKKVGYNEEYIMNIDPLDKKVKEEADQQIRNWAEEALTLIEKEHKLPSHLGREAWYGINWGNYRKEVEEKLINI